MPEEYCCFHDNDGNEITVTFANGIELSPHEFKEVDICRGEEYVVQILKCKKCGYLSFGWTRIGEDKND